MPAEIPRYLITLSENIIKLLSRPTDKKLKKKQNNNNKNAKDEM